MPPRVRVDSIVQCQLVLSASARTELGPAARSSRGDGAPSPPPPPPLSRSCEHAATRASRADADADAAPLERIFCESRLGRAAGVSACAATVRAGSLLPAAPIVLFFVLLSFIVAVLIVAALDGQNQPLLRLRARGKAAPPPLREQQQRSAEPGSHVVLSGGGCHDGYERRAWAAFRFVGSGCVRGTDDGCWQRLRIQDVFRWSARNVLRPT